VKHFNLVEFYKSLFFLTNSKKLSITEVYDMYPWEFDIYITMLQSYLEEESQKLQEQIAKERFE
jgi:hypothetical protein